MELATELAAAHGKVVQATAAAFCRSAYARCLIGGDAYTYQFVRATYVHHEEWYKVLVKFAEEEDATMWDACLLVEHLINPGVYGPPPGFRQLERKFDCSALRADVEFVQVTRGTQR